MTDLAQAIAALREQCARVEDQLRMGDAALAVAATGFHADVRVIGQRLDAIEASVRDVSDRLQLLEGLRGVRRA